MRLDKADMVVDRHVPAWVAALAAVIVGWSAIQAQIPPAPLPAHAEAGLFAAGRAQKHVEAIAREPHPMASAESARVRETIVRQLEEIGLAAEIQSSKLQMPPAPQNVLTRIKGQGTPGMKALMLCAHYDSAHEGPGASDDAAGVAVVLETLRALRAGPPLERDVIALLTDGEEMGLLGARLFVDEHPWANDVGVVLNFDARGISGPSIMFETSDGNGWLIRQYAQATAQPLCTSVSMDIYKKMPNSSDMTIFKNAEMSGLNFAFGAGLAYYHTAEDTPENLDQRTLQHHGENALAAARHFGRLDLEETKQHDVIYWSVLNRVVLSYSKAWVLPPAFIALGLYLVLVLSYFRTADGNLADLLMGAGLFFCQIMASLLAVGTLFLLGTCLTVIREVLHMPPVPWLKYDVSIMTGFALVSTAITVAITRLWTIFRPLRGLVLGTFAWWVGLSLATAFWLPGGSYLFVWPTLGGLLGLAVSSRFAPGRAMASAANLLGSIPALLLVAPLIRTTFDGLSLPMTPPIIVLVVLFSGALMPLWGALVLHKPEFELTPETKESARLQLAVEHAS
jgi:Peptidase family M28